MFDSTNYLLEKLQLGQDSFFGLLEVRVSGRRVMAPRRDALSNELAAFANANGGVCLLGVDDKTREVLGIPEDKLGLVVDFVRQTCLDSVTPPLMPVIERVLLPTDSGEERPVLKVDYCPQPMGSSQCRWLYVPCGR